MFSFRVVDTHPQGRLAAISDHGKRRHIVRLFAAVPEIETELEGEAPGPGFHLLLAVGSGQVFRAVFEAIDCSEQFVFECFHELPALPRVFHPLFAAAHADCVRTASTASAAATSYPVTGHSDRSWHILSRKQQP